MESNTISIETSTWWKWSRQWIHDNPGACVTHTTCEDMAHQAGLQHAGPPAVCLFDVINIKKYHVINIQKYQLACLKYGIHPDHTTKSRGEHTDNL